MWVLRMYVGRGDRVSVVMGLCFICNSTSSRNPPCGREGEGGGRTAVWALPLPGAGRTRGSLLTPPPTPAPHLPELSPRDRWLVSCLLPFGSSPDPRAGRRRVAVFGGGAAPLIQVCLCNQAFGDVLPTAVAGPFLDQSRACQPAGRISVMGSPFCAAASALHSPAGGCALPGWGAPAVIRVSSAQAEGFHSRQKQ